MTKHEAFTKTYFKFTNILDGKVKYGIGVKTIVEYYEGLLKDEPIYVKTTSNIMQNFVDDDIDFMEDSDF